jgi:hypothetical protein
MAMLLTLLLGTMIFGDAHAVHVHPLAHHRSEQT